MEDNFFEWLKGQGINNPMASALSRYYGTTDFLQRLIGTDGAKLSSQISYDMWSQSRDEYNYEKYESPAARMEAMKKAGINENIAAAGIAGAAGQTSGIDSPANGAVPTSSQSPISQVAGLAADIAGAAQGFAGANATNAKLAGELRILDNQSVKLLKEIGIDDWTIRSMQLEFPYMERKIQADLYLKIAQVNETNQRWQNLAKEHDNIVASYQKIISETAENWSEVGQNIASADRMVAEKALIEEEKRWRKVQTDFWQEEGYDLNNPSYVALHNCVVNGKLDNAQKIGQAIYDSSNAEGRGRFAAEDQYAYSIAFQRQQGVDVADAITGKIGSWADLIGKVGYGLNASVNDVVYRLQNLGEAPKANQIRKELNEVLVNAYDQLEKFPEDSKRIQEVIDKISMLLQLNNTELIKAYNLLNK